MGKDHKNFSAEEIVNLFNQKKYQEIMDIKYTDALKKGIRKGSLSCFSEDFISLKYLCYAAYLAGYYYDCLVLMKTLFSYVPFTESIYEPEDKIHFAEYALESLWYYSVNEIREDWNIDFYIHKVFDEAPTLYALCGQTDKLLYDKVSQIYELNITGKTPYYMLSFFVPFALNFNNYTFDLESADPFLEMTTSQESRGQVDGTRFTLKLKGFINADTWWKGPIWEERQEFNAVIPALNMVNRLLLITSEGDFAPRIRPDQLSSIDIYQYMGDGTLYRFCSGTRFDAQFINKWFPRSHYEQSELQKINQLLVEAYNYPLYAKLYHQAENITKAGLYEESFMSFCTCAEAMLHYWCNQLAEAQGLKQEFSDFVKPKSICEPCSLYQKDPSAKGVSNSVLPPPVFKYPTFLRSNKIINGDQEKLLKKLIMRSRNDDLRNALIHGRINFVKLAQVKGCQNAIDEMNNFFVSISK